MRIVFSSVLSTCKDRKERIAEIAQFAIVNIFKDLSAQIRKKAEYAYNQSKETELFL